MQLELSQAAVHARFGHGHLASIQDHHAATTGPTHRAGEDHSLTKGTSSCAAIATAAAEPCDDAAPDPTL